MRESPNVTPDLGFFKVTWGVGGISMKAVLGWFGFTVEALNSALLNSGKALFSGQNLGDQLFLCSKSP